MFRRLPVSRKLLMIVGVFVAIVVCVFYLGVLRSDILSGVRAYVGGEGLWSKAEKRAALSLTDYAASHSESDYQQYLAEIAVPIGDKQARLQLQRSSPNMELVRARFRAGPQQSRRRRSHGHAVPSIRKRRLYGARNCGLDGR